MNSHIIASYFFSDELDQLKYCLNLSDSGLGFIILLVFVKHINVMVLLGFISCTLNSIVMESYTTKHVYMIGNQLRFKFIIKTIEQIEGMRLWRDMEVNIHI